MMGTTGSSNQNLNVFTAAQWEELEQQALIYKYMVSGVPVPTDLILSVRRSLYNSSSSSLSNQPTLGVWEGGFQYNQMYQIGGVSGYGHGRKIDLEPGRCRRTDGKKWRCSKEAYPDSKYCERHMHRGRNRSRKPVEFTSSSSSSSASSSTATTLGVSSSPSTTLSKSISHSDTYLPFSSIQTNFMDYRYLQGMKEIGEDERSAYLHLHDPYTTTPKMTPQHQHPHQHHHNYSHFNFQNLKEQQQNKQEEETQGQHCYVMGTDFIKSREEKSTSQINTKSEETTSKQPFHHFFSPPKTTPNPNPNPDPAWVEIDQHQHHHHLINPTKSTLSTQDLFQSTPRPYW